MKHVNKLILLALLLIVAPVMAYAYEFSLLPNAADAYGVGSSTLYWKDLYAAVTHIQSGSNKKGGTVTVNGATPVPVSNTAYTANSVVVFSLKTVGGTVGAIPHLATATASTGFDVVGTASDTSVYNYAIVELF